jgi:septum formation protein
MGVILASASPRRKRLLKKIVRHFEVKEAGIDERILHGKSFRHAAARLAYLKAKKVAKKEKNAVVIGADTVAFLGKRNFRKTENETTAKSVLNFISGKTHYVVTGVAVVFPRGKTVKYSVKAAVRMKKLNAKMINGYLKTGEWKGRAGCYDYSGKGRKLVASVKGEKETVVGLPLKKLRLVLGKA